MRTPASPAGTAKASIEGCVAAITLKREGAYRRFQSGGDTEQVLDELCLPY